jgi:tRNA pseudouridine38-40 synthase
MNFYKIIVSYDGTDFSGWQIQPYAPTISSSIQNTFEKVFNQKITVVGASRTDTGVHALGQVARFCANIPLSDQELLTVLNRRMPKSIALRSLETMPHYFHPCTNVIQKTYHYVLFYRRPLPFIARFGWHYEFVHQVDWEKFHACLACYQGEHDFASFCKIERDDISSVRTIDNITLKRLPRFGAMLVTIYGKSFLHFQIRRMIGYALEVARRQDLTVDYITYILKNPNPVQTLVKADASGLCLRKVTYEHIKK